MSMMIYNKDDDAGFEDESPVWKANLKVVFRNLSTKSANRIIFIKAFSKSRVLKIIDDIFGSQKKNLDYRVLSVTPHSSCQ